MDVKTYYHKNYYLNLAIVTQPFLKGTKEVTTSLDTNGYFHDINSQIKPAVKLPVFVKNQEMVIVYQVRVYFYCH